MKNKIYIYIFCVWTDIIKKIEYRRPECAMAELGGNIVGVVIFLAG